MNPRGRIPEPWLRLTRVRGALLLALALAGLGWGGGTALMGGSANRSLVRASFAQALARRDAGAAWQLARVPPASSKASRSFLGEDALAAALRSAPPAALTGQVYAHGFGLVNVQSPFSPLALWRVNLIPGYLRVRLPAGYRALELDGRRVTGLGSKPTLIAVLPLPHRLTAAGGSLTLPVGQTLTAAPGQTIEVDWNPQLTSAAQGQAALAVAAAIGSCLGSHSVQPPGCPQSAVLPALARSVAWSQVGDAAAGLGFALDQQGLLLARGRFQFVMSYQLPGQSSPDHVAVGGAFWAQLDLSNGIRVAALGPDPAARPPGRPPAASDAAAIAAAVAGLRRCAAQASMTPSDCPQSDGAAGRIVSPHWTLEGDPAAQATVAYDPQTALYTVSGPFAMTVTYQTQELSVTPHRDPSATTWYRAGLFFQRSEFDLVSITGRYG